MNQRAKQILNLVVNSIAFGSHDNDGEVGALAEELGTTPARLQKALTQLKDEGLIVIKSDFIYPTIAGLKHQQPTLSDKDAKAILRKVR